MNDITKIKSFKVHGRKAIPTTVEVMITDGIGIHLTGIASEMVKESLLRTITALQSQGYRIPGKKIIINITPGQAKGYSNGLDLAIATGILAASGQGDLSDSIRTAMSGELGLDGRILPTGHEQLMALSSPEGIIISSEAIVSLQEKAETGNILHADTLADAVSLLAAIKTEQTS